MCELFGVSASGPVHLTYSLHAFARHGGLLHPNKSGWGIAYREGRDALVIKEPNPAAESPWVRFIESQPVPSDCIIAHVRYATAGAPVFANTHPFLRELGGHMHFFAHNGGLEGIWDALPLPAGDFRPVGETDSEHAFCVLLSRLASLWRTTKEVPPLQERLAVVAETAAALRRLGTANFLYSDGDVLFAHAHRRRWDRNGSFSEPLPPGLSIGNLLDVMPKGLRVRLPERDTAVLYLASVPLTPEGWTPLPEGCVVALRQGAEVARTGAQPQDGGLGTRGGEGTR